MTQNVYFAPPRKTAFDSYPDEVKEAVNALLEANLPTNFKDMFVKGAKLTLTKFPRNFFTDKYYENAVLTLADNLGAFINNGITFNKSILENLKTAEQNTLTAAYERLKEVERQEAADRKEKKVTKIVDAATAPLKKQLSDKDEVIANLQAEIDEQLKEYDRMSAEQKKEFEERTNELLAQAKKDGDERAMEILEKAKKAMILMKDTYDKKLDETKKLIPPRVLSNQEKQAIYKSFGPVIDKAAREHIPDDNLPYFFNDRGITNHELQKSLAQVVRQREAGLLNNRMINERILNKPELLDTLTAPMKDEYFENVPQFRQPRPQDLPLPIQNENWETRTPIPKRWLTRRMYWQVKNM